MAYLPTLPRRSWLERISLALAGSLTLLGALGLLGWWLRIDVLVQPLASAPAFKANAALCFLALGLALFGLERGWRQAAWTALLPAALSGLTMLEGLAHTRFGIDELLARDHLLAGTGEPGRMSALVSCCIFLSSLAMLWRGQRRGARSRLFAEAVISSITTSAGFSTLLGYAANLPGVYSWGSSTATAPLAALGLVALGLALLTLAWRETMKTDGGPPAWSPLPAVIGCLTLSTILWFGLREREVAYLKQGTETAISSFATKIAIEFDRQSSAIERLSRTWGELPDGSDAVWETDSHTQWQDSSKARGCVSIAVINPALRTIWNYPRDANEAFLDYDHGSGDVAALTAPAPARGKPAELDARRARRNAIDTARRARSPVVSGSLELPNGGKGFVIYSPLDRRGEPVGFVAAEFNYRQFFGNLVAENKLSPDYYVAIKVGNEPAYESYPDAEAGALPNAELTNDSVATIRDRRIRISLTPSDALLNTERRFIPELALGAGFGITLLLGLSVHLARSARAGQRAAELSNQKLVAENEERRRVEARLKISDERLRLALDSTQIGIFEWNVGAGHVYYSPGLWSMLAYEHARMPSTVEAWQSLIHPDDLPLYRRRVESQLAGIASFIEPEYRVRAKGGEWRWVYTRSKSVATGTNGRPTRIIGTVQDITARREAEQALRESQAEARKLSLVAAKTDNPVLIASPSGRIEWVNESFSRVMEYALDEVVGKSPADFMIGSESQADGIESIRAAIASGQGLSADAINYSKSGRKFHLHLEVQPVHDESGELQNFIIVETDITTRVETEFTLRRAKLEADAASRAKSEFLASMSHEIRTPMNGVIGMTSLLMETPLNVEQRDFVNTIRTSGEALLTIINDILDFSKIESGKLDLERMPFELAVCLEEALDLFALQASAKKLEIVYHLDATVPSWIIGDVTRLRQIVVNLVNNAVKFTPRGSIAIEVRRLPEPEVHRPGGRFLLEFTVRDSGIGIPADRLDRLFKAFSQVDSSTTRKYGGTGLGLAISQRLSSLMGGSIRVESTVGQGSSFIFAIETESAALGHEPALPSGLHLLRQQTVLCVEDHPVTARRLETMLRTLGAQPTFAPNAAAAVALAPTLAQPPALIIIDGDETEGSSPLEVMLPLKAPRLLMLPFGQTAPPPPADRLPFASIFKPFKNASLLHTLAQLLSPSLQPIVASGTGHSFKKQLAEEFPLDVLLAEDNAVNQKVALRFLERLGYRADAVGNGLEVLTTLKHRRYDLVLMDLQMPEMDGLEASRQIRRHFPADQQPKIIALTANAMQGDREQCMEAGMDDYISKPVKLHDVEASIRRLFSTDGVPNTPPAVG